jgi:hypothetical protein
MGSPFPVENSWCIPPPIHYAIFFPSSVSVVDRGAAEASHNETRTPCRTLLIHTRRLIVALAGLDHHPAAHGQLDARYHELMRPGVPLMLDHAWKGEVAGA